MWVALGKAELAVGEMVVNLEGVLVTDEVVIAGEDQRGSADGFEGLRVDVGLVEEHLRYFSFALALRSVPFGACYSIE